MLGLLSVITDLLFLSACCMMAGDDAGKKYTVWSLMKVIPDSVSQPTVTAKNWLIVLQLSYFLFVFVFPLLQTVGLLALWIIPLPLGLQSGMFTLSKFSRACTALPIFTCLVA